MARRAIQAIQGDLMDARKAINLLRKQGDTSQVETLLVAYETVILAVYALADHVKDLQNGVVKPT